MAEETQEKVVDSLMEKLKNEKDSANELQERKHDEWEDNYQLYRGKNKTNRLTQRQAVSIPLMKETIKTIISKIDEAPNVDWKERDGDEDKEIIYQELWDAGFKENKLELVDIKDKKNVLIYGTSVKKLNITDIGVAVEVLDPFDTVFDPLMVPGDIETARFIVHQNIFRTARDILADERYEKKGKDELKKWILTEPGITQSMKNKEEWEKKMERLQALGVDSGDFPLFAGGDRIINITEHYTNMWDVKAKKWERRVVVYADDEVVLLDEPLKGLIGVDFWPFVAWHEDPETVDVYPDAVADLIRTPNKVVNVWFSQLIENRTLKNFQMHWYLPSEGYQAQTYTPGPGMMLPAPPSENGRISDVIQPVEISGLDDTLEAISALTNIVERASGATAIEKGTGESGTQTLGEIEILVGKSLERAVGMAKFYRMAWYETAVKWDKLMHANGPRIATLYKTGRSGKIYTKKVFKSDWRSSAGYEPIIRSTSEQEQESIKQIQKFQFAMTLFPENGALKKVASTRVLESLDLSPEELKEIEEFGQEEPNPVQPQEVAEEPPQPVEQPEDNTSILSEIDTALNELEV